MRKSKNKLSTASKKAVRGLLGVFIIVVIVIGWWILKPAGAKDIVPKYTFSSIKISILNGCGQKNAATEVKDFLIENEIQNLDIISWKNVAREKFIYDKSLIVVKKNNEEKLNFLMNLTGIQRRIFAENDQFIEEFQIILGSDYKQFFN